MAFVKKICFLLILTPCISLKSTAVVFKAEAPESQEDEIKYGFGSILPKKLNFFSESSKNKRSSHINTAKTKKDKLWNITIYTLTNLGLPISYANKEQGIIRSDKGYIAEFDSTNSYLYRATINVSETGEISVNLKSEEDSTTRTRKLEEKLKSMIIIEASKED